jgi:hypothetical protein
MALVHGAVRRVEIAWRGVARRSVAAQPPLVRMRNSAGREAIHPSAARSQPAEAVARRARP